MLGLQAECAATYVSGTALALQRSVEEVSCVELDARLGSGDAEHAPGRWFIDFGGLEKLAGWRVEHPVMIVAFAEADLLVVGVDVVADSRRLGEIERSIRYWAKLTGGDQS